MYALAKFRCLSPATRSHPQYFIILLVLFVVLLVGGILGYVFNERVEDTITTTMMGELDSYSTRQSIKDAWDAAQLQVRSGRRSGCD